MTRLLIIAQDVSGTENTLYSEAMFAELENDNISIAFVPNTFTEKSKLIFYQKVESFKPEVIFFQSTFMNYLDIGELKDLSEEYFLMARFDDNPEYYEEYFYYISKYLNAILVDDPLEVGRYLSNGIFADFQLWTTIDSYQHSNSERDIDVAFIGRMDRPERVEIFERLLNENNLKTLIAGSGTERGFVSNVEMIEIYKRSKIVLNLTTISLRKPFYPFENKKLATVRSFKGRGVEAHFCGSMVMNQFSYSTRNVFEAGKDYVEFENIEDLVKKIKYYINNESERIKIANSGLNKVQEIFGPKASATKFLDFIERGKRAKNNSSIPILTEYKRFMVRAIVQNLRIDNIPYSFKRLYKNRNLYILFDFSFHLFINLMRRLVRIFR